MYSGGYTGKIAWIVLTQRSAEIQKNCPDLANMYMGGADLRINTHLRSSKARNRSFRRP
jgi:aldehyde:ferredoxin oxidoreductase